MLQCGCCCISHHVSVAVPVADPGPYDMLHALILSAETLVKTYDASGKVKHWLTRRRMENAHNSLYDVKNLCAIVEQLRCREPGCMYNMCTAWQEAQQEA